MEDKMVDEFLFVNNWFDSTYRHKSLDRFWTFKIALNILLQYGGKNIVETGCQRLKEDWGGGCSTLLFGNFCQQYNCHLWTVDINQMSLQCAKEETKEFADFISYEYNDSVQFLTTFNKPIDLLYLDSLDYPIEEHIPKDTCQQHSLNELKEAWGKLTKNAVVLMDDNNFPGGGKTKLSKKYLLDNGWLCLMDWQQTLWIRKS
jgi:hypothetical protein